jgi:hypothetical protein
VLRIQDVYPGSGILIFTHPGAQISDPGTKTAIKVRGEKNCYRTFFCSHTFNKIEYYYHYFSICNTAYRRVQAS